MLLKKIAKQLIYIGRMPKLCAIVCITESISYSRHLIILLKGDSPPKNMSTSHLW